MLWGGSLGSLSLGEPVTRSYLHIAHKSSADPGTGMCVLAHAGMGRTRRRAHADLALGLLWSALAHQSQSGQQCLLCVWPPRGCRLKV